jgi:hypothetical protein
LAETSSEKSSSRPSRWAYVRVATGRVARLLVCTAVLPAAPIAIFFVFFPKSSSPTELLSHGDFAVLAAALATAALAEVIGPAEPRKGPRNFLILSCVCLFASTAILLAGIAGDAPRLSPSRDALLSVISCGVATLLAITAWVVTVEIPDGLGAERQDGTPEAEEAGSS